jgi:hypothetical protein
MLRSCIQDGRSVLCFEPTGPLGSDDAEGVAGDKAHVIDLSLLTATDGSGRRLLSRDHPSELRFVASCEQAGTLGESIAGVPVAPGPAICEPCGIWVSLDAIQER